MPQVTIGFVSDGAFDDQRELIADIQAEVRNLTRGEFEVQFPEGFNIVEEWSVQAIQASVDQMLTGNQVDLLITVGLVASHYAAMREVLPIPVIALGIVDAEAQGLPSAGARSGKTNLNYLEIPNAVSRDVALLNQIVPVKRMALLISENLLAISPTMPQALAETDGADVTWSVVPIGNDVGAALASVPDDVEAAYLMPLPHLAGQRFTALINGLHASKLPTLSHFGEAGVLSGVLASLNPDITDRAVRRTALHVQQILLGQDAGSLAVSFVPTERLMINEGTAEQIGLDIPLGILIEAELINPLPGTTGNAVNIEAAIREGTIENFALLVESWDTKDAAQQIQRARARLLPQLTFDATGLLVDKNIAETSLGTQPERTLSSALTVSQILYSEGARANVAIEQHLQDVQEYEYDALYLDIAEGVGQAYVNVLRTLSFERIESDNLNVTRSNLELARARESLGQANAAEVLRWESQIAQNRRRRIDTYGQRQVAEIALNQILNRPLAERFATVDIPLDASGLLLNAKLLDAYGADFDRIQRLETFLVQEGLAHAPELEALEAAIRAQERFLKSRKNAFWAPTVALQGQVNTRHADGGAGTGGTPLPPDLGLDFPSIDKTQWNVGINVSLPLFQGNGRVAEREQAQIQLNQLLTERDLLSQRIEQNIRSQFQLTGVSYVAIEQAQQAADAARTTLDLVQVSYGNGVATILDVIDAQNTVRTTEELVTNAIYDFLSGAIRTERAIGTLGFLQTEEERTHFEERLAAFYEATNGQ